MVDWILDRLPKWAAYIIDQVILEWYVRTTPGHWLKKCRQCTDGRLYSKAVQHCQAGHEMGNVLTYYPNDRLGVFEDEAVKLAAQLAAGGEL